MSHAIVGFIGFVAGFVVCLIVVSGAAYRNDQKQGGPF